MPPLAEAPPNLPPAEFQPRPNSTLTSSIAPTGGLEAAWPTDWSAPEVSTAAPESATDVPAEDASPHIERHSGSMLSNDSNLDEHIGKHAETKGMRKWSLLKKFGRVALVEVVGLGVDAALIGAGHAGVEALTNVVHRESLASSVDAALLGKALDNGHSAERDKSSSKVRRAAKSVGRLLTGVTVAVAAQKTGVAVVDALNPNVTQAVHDYGVPLASKVSGLVGLNMARNRFAARKAQRQSVSVPDSMTQEVGNMPANLAAA